MSTVTYFLAIIVMFAVAVVLIRGPAIVNQYEISIPGAPTAPQIAAAHAALLTLGILVR